MDPVKNSQFIGTLKMEIRRQFEFGTKKLEAIFDDEKQMNAFGYDNEEIRGILKTM